MDMETYERSARATVIYPDMGTNPTYPTLGLVGESGEVAEKLKKIIRDKGGKPTEEDKHEIAKELGDVLWYVANLAAEFGYSLSTIAQMNLEKLHSRKDRGVLQGSGDNR